MKVSAYLAKPCSSTHEVVILGAGAPHSGEGTDPVLPTSSASNAVDWILHSVAHLDPDMHFVSGYDDASRLQRNYPDINFWRNEDWAETRAIWSLLQVPLANPDHDRAEVRRLTVIYSDIVFREDAVRKLELDDAEVVVAVDSMWRHRYAGRTQEDMGRCEKVCVAEEQITRLGPDIDSDQASAEFVGLVQFGPKAIELIADFAKNPPQFLRKANLSDLIELFRMNGLKVRAVDLVGDWAELNHPHDLARFVLGTKSQTLLRLKDVLRNGRIEDLVSFTVGTWDHDPAHIIDRIKTSFPTGTVIVRSSALSEDGFASSQAGAYESILNVDALDTQVLTRAIQKVADSYSSNDPADEILAQPMLQEVLVSGVAFTRTLGTGAPYIVVNYDTESGSTESVTSGSAGEQKTVFLRHDRAMDSPNTPPALLPLLRCLREIIDLLNYDALDVEFAITEDYGLHILQVRSLVTGGESLVLDSDVCDALDAAEETFRQAQAASPWLVGRRTIFGTMPDWNPAEIVGKRPDPLAYSLYCDLICDEVWAQQRAEFGYRDVRPQPLLMSFAGHPYVDVRASLNSFVPAELDEDIAERLVSFALDRLESQPELHDKIEFHVIPTCLALDFGRWQKRLVTQAGFSLEDCGELRESLSRLTVCGMSRVTSDLAQVATLEHRLTQLRNADLPPLSKAFALLEDVKRFGTLPFAHLARNGFIAMTLLRSAVEMGVLLHEEMEDFLRTVKTVSQRFTGDAKACVEGTLSWDQFVEQYGHLRPGTYDVTSPNYRQDPEQYLRPALKQAQSAGAVHESHGAIWAAARNKLASAMAAEGLPGDIEEIETFLREAIEGREYAKFIFSRNLSLALDLFSAWGEGQSLDRKDLAMLDLADLRGAARSSSDMLLKPSKGETRAYLRTKIDIGHANRALAEAIELPPLICKCADLHVFQYPASTPNFVGSQAVIAPIVEVDEIYAIPNVEGCIVVIPSADPGYDWLFAQGIAGLVTMYGGANSHMAIRAAEFDLPAAIGVGPTLYKTLSQASDAQLDPRNHVVRVIQ